MPQGITASCYIDKNIIYSLDIELSVQSSSIRVKVQIKNKYDRHIAIAIVFHISEVVCLKIADN